MTDHPNNHLQTSGFQHNDGLEAHHEFEHFEPHHSLSPFSMNIGGTLSRPSSMTSMGNLLLPPTNTLSRVSSLSNLNMPQHQILQSSYSTGLYFNPVPYFSSSNFSQQQSQQGPGAHGQNPSNLQPMIGNDFRAHEFLPSHQSIVRMSGDMKPVKKSKSKRTSSSQDSSAKSLKLDLDGSVPEPKPRSRNPSSIYRGVSKCSKDGRWQARIRVKRQVTYLGRFVNEEDAARKYDEAARQHHGDKAVLNFPTEEDKKLGRKQATSALGLVSNGNLRVADADLGGDDSE